MENLYKSELHFIEWNIFVVVLRKLSQWGQLGLLCLKNEENGHLRVGKIIGE